MHFYRKQADGLFLECCREVSKSYPEIEFDAMIVDNTAMQLVSRPDQFDVMLTPNLYGNVMDFNFSKLMFNIIQFSFIRYSDFYYQQWCLAKKTHDIKATDNIFPRLRNCYPVQQGAR